MFKRTYLCNFICIVIGLFHGMQKKGPQEEMHTGKRVTGKKEHSFGKKMKNRHKEVLFELSLSTKNTSHKINPEKHSQENSNRWNVQNKFNFKGA